MQFAVKNLKRLQYLQSDRRRHRANYNSAAISARFNLPTSFVIDLRPFSTSLSLPLSLLLFLTLPSSLPLPLSLHLSSILPWQLGKNLIVCRHKLLVPHWVRPVFDLQYLSKHTHSRGGGEWGMQSGSCSHQFNLSGSYLHSRNSYSARTFAFPTWIAFASTSTLGAYT